MFLNYWVEFLEVKDILFLIQISKYYKFTMDISW